MKFLIPFIMAGDGKGGFEPHWMQFENERTVGRHRRCTLDNWMMLDSERVNYDGKEVAVPLVKSVDGVNKKTFTINFGGGRLIVRLPNEANIDGIERFIRIYESATDNDA